MFDRKTAEMYDEVVGAGYHNQEKYLAWLSDNIFAKDSVLELGCGTGEIMIPLMKSGMECEGVDNSSFMLEILKEKNSDAVVYEADIRDFNPSKKYDFVLSCSGPFSIKDDELESYIINVGELRGVLRKYLDFSKNGVLVNKGNSKDGLVLKLSDGREFRHREIRDGDMMFMVHALYKDRGFLDFRVDVKRRYPLSELGSDFRFEDLGDFYLIDNP